MRDEKTIQSDHLLESMEGVLMQDLALKSVLLYKRVLRENLRVRPRFQSIGRNTDVIYPAFFASAVSACRAVRLQ
jgi:hypothetical protein